MRDIYTYDLEVYPNIFTFCGKFRSSTEIQMFELSDRMNEISQLQNFVSYLRNVQVENVGFNNLGYDYFLIHDLLVNPYTFNYDRAFQISQQIIVGNGYKPFRFHERLIPQLDPVKICHFDNKAKRTSLKALQFAMRSHSLEDLPFDIRPLNHQEKDILKAYNVHDVLETEKFFNKIEHLVDMRREYVDNGILQGDVLNYSDVKIGIEYLVARLGRNKCYAGGKPKRTMREMIDFKHIILPKIYFRTEPYQEVLSWFKEQQLYVASGKRPSLEKNLAGLEFHFGIGGVHASAESKVFKSTETHQIVDVDVAAMYPSVAIANSFAPEHLGETFVHTYRQIRDDRKRYPKGTSQNAALKLAGNGAYGNSNNPFSFMYDPKFTFSVTVNGQLQLLQLVELVDLLPDCELIQANTDGITVYINKKYLSLFDFWCREWEKMTDLVLERVDYSRMWIRDVNNYISEKMDGGLKRKGTYWYPLCEKDYEGAWNKDYSNLASKIAAEKVMTHSWPVELAIKLVTDKFDFMLRYKATGGSKLFIGDTQQLKTVRFYMSTTGEPMKKVSPPKGELGQYKRKNGIDDKLFKDVMKEIADRRKWDKRLGDEPIWDERIHTKNKSKYEIRETSIQSGWKVKQCNVADDFNWNDVDWNFYIEEAKKIIIGSK